MLKLWHTVQIDEERTAHLNDGVIAREQTHEVGKPLRNRDISQLAGIGHAGKQHLVLVAAAEDFFTRPTTPAALLCCFICKKADRPSPDDSKARKNSPDSGS